MTSSQPSLSVLSTSLEFHVFVFVSRKKHPLHRRAVYICYGLEIDPGDGGAEDMKKNEHFIAPRLSREASQKQNKTGRYTQDGVLRWFWAAVRRAKRSRSYTIDPHVAGVPRRMPEMGGKSHTTTAILLHRLCAPQSLITFINLQNSPWSKKSAEKTRVLRGALATDLNHEDTVTYGENPGLYVMIQKSGNLPQAT